MAGRGGWAGDRACEDMVVWGYAPGTSGGQIEGPMQD